MLVMAAGCQPGAVDENGPGTAVEKTARALSPGSPLPSLDFMLRAVLGQGSARQVGFNRIVPWAGFNIAGVHVRRTPAGQARVYIADGANSRILAFDGYKDQNTPADLVLGQPSGYDHGAPNGDFPVRRLPTASTLAFFTQPMLSPTEDVFGIHIDTDAAGNLYVPDPSNNRVLKYNDPFSDATPNVADEVWGQGTTNSFTTLAPGAGPTGMTLERKFWITSVGLDVDAQGNLWVADPGNRRVMMFRKNGGVIDKAASLCLGAADCNSPANGQINLPISVQVSAAGDTVYVLEGSIVGETGTGKVLKYTGSIAAGFTLQTSFTGPSLTAPRGMTLDGNTLWIADTANGRVLKVDLASPTTPTVVKQLGSGPGVTFPDLFDHTEISDPLGSFGVDALTGEVVFGWHVRGVQRPDPRYFPGVVRIAGALPPAPALPLVNKLLLHEGDNLLTAEALASLHGMAYYGNQLFLDDDGYIKTYNDPETKDGFAAPSFISAKVVGNSRRVLVAGGGQLFVSVGGEIRIFQLPITANGQAPWKTLYSTTNFPGQPANVRWADDPGTFVEFDQTALGTGMAYDPAAGVLWVTDAPRHRVLRIRDPLGSNPVVDLALGQTSKTATAINGGTPQGQVSKSGFDALFTLALDLFGNLYVVDGSFEGGGNKRVLRFDAVKLVPPPTIFFNPALNADAVFARTDWRVSVDKGPQERHWPNHPVNVVFDRDNHMIMMNDGYGDPSVHELNQVDNAIYERLFFFERPHLGVDAIEPDKVLQLPAGQAAFGHFLGGAPERFFLQDHTWARINQVALLGLPSTLAPFIQDGGADGLVAIEAEHHTSRKVQGGHDWLASQQTGFSGEGALAALPNTGANVISGITTGSPRLDFKVKFVKTGTHYLWVRGFAPTSGDDFVHAGLDGTVASTADSLGSFPAAWTWRSSDAGGARATLNVTAAGEHTVSLWMQKDGFIVDRILLTTSAGYTPSGAEPESPRPAVTGSTVVVAPVADAHVRDGSSAGTNFGSAATMEQKTSTVVGNNRRAFLRFPLDGVASGVSAARLRIFGSSVTSAKLVGVYAVADVSWGESTVTWTTAPAIGAKQGSSMTVGTTAGYVEWDVGAYVQAQKAAGATAVSFEVKQDTANNEGPTTFNSRQATANRPELVVTAGGASNLPPVCGQPQATPSPVTGATTALSLTCLDDGGEPALGYSWTATGPAAVTFSANGSNAAKNTTATFTRAGTYTFVATVTDGGGQATTARLEPQILQTVTTIAVAPASASVPTAGNQQFTATASDQFGNPLAQAPIFAWTVSGGGTIDPTGRFTAGPTPGGPFTVTAASWGQAGTAQVTVTGGGGGTFPLAAEADAHVRDGSSAGTNFGTLPTLEQKSSTVTGNNRRAFFRFPIASVTGSVTSAKLRLFGSSATSAKLVGVFAVASLTWSETGVNWSTAPAIGPKQGASKTVGTTAATVEWDVTAYLQAQKAAGATAVSFEVKQDTANNEGPTTFNSRENAANQPQLLVTTGP
jgi:sugar lactone lactonase YvrE